MNVSKLVPLFTLGETWDVVTACLKKLSEHDRISVINMVLSPAEKKQLAQKWIVSAADRSEPSEAARGKAEEE